MPPSQLKQLKASLREHGVLGPQKSKKQRKAVAKDGQKRLQRNAALEGIRERFNPFEVKAPARREKFEVASNRTSKSTPGRPGVTRGLGEERRKETLLKEIQARNKVGGVLDRRFGENDPTMTPEQKAAERFARQNERKIRKTSMFNLEDDSEEEMTLTHGGRSLDFGDTPKDDYEDDDSGSPDDGVDAEDMNERPRKRLRLEDDDQQVDGEEGLPQRKKTKNEVMKELIAKSKMHKAERQAAKADDDDLRLELDKGMSEFYEALRGHKATETQVPHPPGDSEPMMNPARAAMLAGKSRDAAEREYEANLRQMKMDARSKPSLRTKTEEEKASEEAARLEELERKRVRRMKGEMESSDDDVDIEQAPDEDIEQDDAELFGLAQPEILVHQKEINVEDEDEFVLDDDLIASDSDVEVLSDVGMDSRESDEEIEDDGDDDFINGLVLPPKPVRITTSTPKQKPNKSLAFTYPCPRTHGEFLDILQGTQVSDLPTIVQRIRALYHKGLAEDNQAKLEKFSAVLTEHVAYLADHHHDLPFAVLESLLRHLHSMAKSLPEAVGGAFRAHLSEICEQRSLALNAGDLVILTGVSTIFPTSDHFHSVVTPAMLTIGRYLGQSSIQSLRDLGIGAYTCSLALQYQRLAKRYVPEVITYIVNAINILSPSPIAVSIKAGEPLNTPLRTPAHPLRIQSSIDPAPRKITFNEMISDGSVNDSALLNTFIRLSIHAAELWKTKTAFIEIVAPLIQAISHVDSQRDLPKSTLKLASEALSTITALHTTVLQTRKPLLLHNHRPLAIKTSIPVFIENYNPDRHYDPDRERAELAKLKAEHKKERKGAMRELRKDANFVAREQLREKKEKDAAYEKKFKRLVAEIQGEEGKEAKEYDREKRKRTGRM